MSDHKQMLALKKAKLAEMHTRKLAREIEKKTRVDGFTQTKFSYKTGPYDSKDSFDIVKTLPDPVVPSNEFDNMNVDEILGKFCVFKSSDTTLFTPSAASSVLDSYGDDSIDYEESIAKRIEHLSITTNMLPNQINIYPPEPITYNKETQTVTSLNLPVNEDAEDVDESLNKSQEEQKSRKKRRSKKPQREKPLAYYDDIFIYDTFEWEDEVAPEDLMSNGNGSDFTKELNLENLNFLETQLGLNENFFSDTNKLINGIHNLASDDEDLAQDGSGLHFTENFLNSPKPKFIHTEEKLSRFLSKKRPIIERALAQNAKNIFFDYSAALNENSSNESNDTVIKLKQTFPSTSPSVVTCLDWSLQYPELLLCAYENMSFNYEEAASESVAAIWNARNGQKVPQQILTCTSLITSCCFASFNSNLIIGGTYSGQIVMWDIRCNKPTPIQRSALSVAAHTNPVYCVKAVNSRDSFQLVSISNDGKLCTWSLENLNLPIDTTELYLSSTNRHVYATCFDFQTVVNNDTVETTEQNNEPMTNISRQQPANESYSYVSKNLYAFKQFVIAGAEDGLLHSLTKNTNHKFSPYESFSDHFGPVTAVSCYNQCNDNEYSYHTNESLSQLFLSSSFDGSIKLWSSMDNSGPIHSFECNGEYVYDVSWSPIHPAVFASVDGSGKLDLWNLNKDTELPSASIDIDNGVRALNKLKWSRKGTEIAVGDDHGHISIFEISDSFSRPEADATRKFLSTVDDLRQMNADFGKMGFM